MLVDGRAGRKPNPTKKSLAWGSFVTLSMEANDPIASKLLRQKTTTCHQKMTENNRFFYYLHLLP
jgi:hypothetical protein